MPKLLIYAYNINAEVIKFKLNIKILKSFGINIIRYTIIIRLNCNENTDFNINFYKNTYSNDVTIVLL